MRQNPNEDKRERGAVYKSRPRHKNDGSSILFYAMLCYAMLCRAYRQASLPALACACSTHDDDDDGALIVFLPESNAFQVGH